MRRIPFRPGIVKDDTAYSQEGTWVDGDHVRFRRERPQKIGGYVKITDDGFVGSARGMHAWRDNASIKYLSRITFLRAGRYTTLRQFGLVAAWVLTRSPLWTSLRLSL
jgi:hypothetical protein